MEAYLHCVAGLGVNVVPRDGDVIGGLGVISGAQEVVRERIRFRATAAIPLPRRVL